MKIFCGKAQCDTYLGSVGASVIGANPNPVWRVAPGWVFIDPATGRRASGDKRGVLEHRDSEYQTEMSERRKVAQFRQEAAFRHELDRAGGGSFGVYQMIDPAATIRREVNLPICVRCPNCRAMRMVTVDTLLRARAEFARRVHTDSV